jgi:hypothetical protein
MPAKLRECIVKGEKGWSAESGGHCFTGPDARAKATAQVQAINISVGKKSGAQWAKEVPAKR